MPDKEHHGATEPRSPEKTENGASSLVPSPESLVPAEDRYAGRSGPWISTYSGGRWYFLDPRPEDVRLEDIAHALALTCRYGGHCPRFYSVAEHSLLVASVMPPELRLHGLLHDAAEAYVGDLVSPVKRLQLINCPGYFPHLWPFGNFEYWTLRVIYEGLGLSPNPEDVSAADLAVGARECLEFNIAVTPGREQQAADVTIPHLDPAVAKASWLFRVREELDKRRLK